MALTKQQLEALNNSSFPNNNAGYITPEILRTYNSSSIAAFVDEIAYTIDSASVDSRLDNLETFSSSLVTNFATVAYVNGVSASLTSTASFNQYTQSTNNTINGLATTSSVNAITQSVNNISTSVGLLQTFSGSQYKADSASFSSRIIAAENTGYVTTASFNSYTSSTDTKINSLNTISASYLAFTQSYYIDSASVNNRINSSATTGSNTFNGNQIINGNVSASSFVSASKFVGDGSQLTGLTASVSIAILDEGIYQGNATSLNFTGSGLTASVVAGIALIQAQIDQSTLNQYTLTSSFNSYTASQDFKNTTFATTSSVTALSQSLYFTDTTQSNNISSNSSSIGLLQTFSGSQYKADSSSFNTRINAAGGAPQVQDEGNILGNVTSFNFIGSGVTASVNAGTASITISGTTINTGSFATTGSNTFSGSQTINSPNGTPLIVNHTDATANQNTFIAFQDSSSLVWAIGNSGINDDFVVYNPTTFSTPFSIAQNNNITLFSNVTASGNISSSGNVYGTNINSLNAFTASQYVSNSYFATTGSNSFVGNQRITGSLTISSSAANDLIVLGTQILTGSLKINTPGADYAIEMNENGMYSTWAYGNATFRATGIQVSDPANEQYTGVTSLGMSAGLNSTGDILAFTNNGAASFVTGWAGSCIYISDAANNYWPIFGFQNISNYTDGTITMLTPVKVNQGINVTGSAIFTELTGSLGNFSSSVNSRIIAATNEGQFVTTASFNAYTQSTNDFTSSITSSYNATSQSYNTLSSSFVAVSSSALTHATTGSNTFVGIEIITGSLIITGSVSTFPIALSVTSNTASIDFSKGSIFTLTLPSSSVKTYITASNLIPGQTANLLVTQASALSGSITWASAFKFPSGSSYTGSAVVNAIDLVSFITVNNSTIYSVGAQNLV